MSRKSALALENRRRKEIHVLYTRSLGILNMKLIPLGFELIENSDSGLSALAVLKKGPLIARLALDIRDAVCIFTAESGSPPRGTGTGGRPSSSRYDRYLYLSEPEVFQRFPAELDLWLQEHPLP